MAGQETQIPMFETLFLMVFVTSSPQTIYLRSNVEGMFSAKEIPQKTIIECRDYTGVDPFDPEQMSDIYNELAYMDCVYYDLGAHEHNIYQ